MSSEHQQSGKLRLLLSTIPALLLLLAVEIFGTGEMMHAQFLKLGQDFFTEYHELRHDPEKPSCDPSQFTVTTSSKAADSGDDELDDLLADDDDTSAESDKEASAAVDAELDDLLEDESSEEGAKPESEDDELDDLLGDDDDEASSNEQAMLAARQAAKKNCEDQHAKYKSITARITPSVKRFRALEHFVAGAAKLGLDFLRHILVCLLLICAVTATYLRHHIALRPSRFLVDHRVSEGAQLVANLLLLHSSWSLKRVDEASGIAIEHPEIHYFWIIGFLALVCTNLFHLIKTPEEIQKEEGFTAASIGRALLCVPIYTVMCLVSGFYFLFAEGHSSGLGIYLTKLTEHAILYIHVGLYVWVGMLLKRTRLAPMSFDFVRPLKLSPEILAFVTVVAAALPTAYSGASGIFVIAVGAVIYKELMAAGSRPQLALAATAMSGSMGVVLSPCLLVVIVASLNKQVCSIGKDPCWAQPSKKLCPKWLKRGRHWSPSSSLRPFCWLDIAIC